MLSGDSLWRKWIRENLLKKNSFWAVKKNTQVGSWMWRKMLKLRDVAKLFYRKKWAMGGTPLSGMIISLKEEFSWISWGIEES